MVLKVLETMTTFLAGGHGREADWLDQTGERLQQQTVGLVEAGGEPAKQVQDFLNGSWFGHPLHPALILAPAGSWTTAAVLDLAGARRGADTAIAFGVLASLPTAAAGVMDWSFTSGKARRLGLVHAALNTVALGLYSGSWAARSAGRRGIGVLLSTAGLGTMVVSAYLGGEISYTLGQGINRNAWSPDVGETSQKLEEFQVAARVDDLAEGQLSAGQIEVDGTKISLVLLKRSGQVFALNGTCAHMGGPLAEGKLVQGGDGVGDCVECPWHGSRFSFQDGNVVNGPSAYPQPRYGTRLRDGNVEVRLAR